MVRLELVLSAATGAALLIAQPAAAGPGCTCAATATATIDMHEETFIDEGDPTGVWAAFWVQLNSIETAIQRFERLGISVEVA